MDKPTPPEPAAHMYPSDLGRFAETETFAHAFSVAVGNPDERSEPLVKLSDAISHGEAMAAWGAAQERERPLKTKLWIWENFVDGRPEFWAFDNPFPIHLGDNGDPQTLGEPVGYALFKPSRTGRADVPEHEILRRIKAAHQGD